MPVRVPVGPRLPGGTSGGGAFAMFVNNVHLEATSETTRIGQELGKLCEILCAE